MSRFADIQSVPQASQTPTFDLSNDKTAEITNRNWWILAGQPTDETTLTVAGEGSAILSTQRLEQ